MAVHARAAERETGIPARFALAQAALESGWGRREIRAADGSTSFNVFGIKAGRSWSGPTVDVTTTEFVDGVARKMVQKFRAYASYGEAFADWARLLKGNPRYQQALASGGDPTRFAESLQAAGYATDPAYAAKLTRVINHALLRQSLV
jgi:flagellar protein FlgJ